MSEENKPFAVGDEVILLGQFSRVHDRIVCFPMPVKSVDGDQVTCEWLIDVYVTQPLLAPSDKPAVQLPGRIDTYKFTHTFPAHMLELAPERQPLPPLPPIKVGFVPAV